MPMCVPQAVVVGPHAQAEIQRDGRHHEQQHGQTRPLTLLLKEEVLRWARQWGSGHQSACSGRFNASQECVDRLWQAF